MPPCFLFIPSLTHTHSHTHTLSLVRHHIALLVEGLSPRMYLTLTWPWPHPGALQLLLS